MADCLSAVSWAADQFALRSTSDLFDRIDSATTFQSEDVSVGNILPPDFPALVLGAPIGGVVDAALTDPSFSSYAGPTGSFRLPELQQVAYNAVQSLVDFGHDSQLIPDIDYVEGLDQLVCPDVDLPLPPLDYPTEGALNLPDPVDLVDLQAPDLSRLGDKPLLRSIDYVPYELSNLEPLDLSADLPVYEPPDVDALGWQDELIYVDDEPLREALLQFLEGEGEVRRWLEGVVQDRLYQSGTRTFDLEAKRQIDQVMNEAGARNFSLPNGSTEQRVMAVAGDELEKSYQVSQQIRDEVYEASMNTLTAAIQQSIQVERYHFGLYTRYVRQNLQVYRLNLQLAGDIYNTMVQVTNSISGILRAKLDAYNQYVSAISDENRAVVAQTAFSDAEVESFLAELRMYDADVSLLRKAVQARSADIRDQTLLLARHEIELRGELANVQVLQQNVSAFQRAIQAHGTSLQWQDDVLACFESGVSAASSKASVNNQKFESYRQLLRAEASRSSSYNQYISATTSVLDAEIGRFRRAADAQRTYLSSINSALRDSVSAVSAYSSMAGDSARHAGAYNAAKISYTAAKNDTKVSQAVMDMTQDALDAEVAVQQNRLDAAQERARVTAAGALAQASSTIFGIRVSADGRASERVSGRDSGRISFSGANRRTYSKSCIQNIEPTT